MPISDKVLLEKGGHKLLEDRFVSRDKEEFFIKDMKCASLVEKRSFGGLVGGYYLSIEFCDGDTKYFWFRHRLPLKQVYGAYLTPSFKPSNLQVVSAMEREVSVIILEWAEKINMLINAQKPQQ
jgi:hypothetical protein